jgi:hypothetical protein
MRMTKTRTMALGLAAILGAGLALSAAPAQATPDAAAACIKVSPEARYRGLGYNHIVHVTDICKADAECDVSTDVNPQPTHVSVPAGSAVEVTTFLGSPARVFVPKVVCVMQTH